MEVASQIKARNQRRVAEAGTRVRLIRETRGLEPYTRKEVGQII